MTDIQKDFLHALEKEDDKIMVVKRFTDKVTDSDIDENLRIDIKTCNVYVEYATKKLITEYKHFSDKMDAYIILYHPKLFEVLCVNKTKAEVVNIRNIMAHIIENIYEGLVKDEKYELCNQLLTSEFSDESNNAFEYCYFLTWAFFNKEWVDVEQKYVLDNNKNDILCVNATYRLKHLDSIVMYNNVANIKVPILTDNMINQTIKYKYITPTNIATEPVSMYNSKFEPIKKFSTEHVTILIDYGNGYYTKCFFFNNNEIPTKFAMSVYNGRLKYNDNKMLLFNIVYRDIYKHLPSSCYTEKENKNKLIEDYNTMKGIALSAYNTNRKTCVHAILTDNDLQKIINPKEKAIFEIYIKYLLTCEEYNEDVVINHCCNYIYENIMENKALIDIS